MGKRVMQTCCLLVLACLAAMIATDAKAQSPGAFAGKTVTMYIGFGPGGGYDMWARVVAAHLGIGALYLHEPAHHVVTRALDPLVIEFPQIGLELDDRLLGEFHAPRIADAAVQQFVELGGPVMEPVKVGGRRADDGRDDVRRHQKPESGDLRKYCVYRHELVFLTPFLS